MHLKTLLNAAEVSDAFFNSPLVEGIDHGWPEGSSELREAATQFKEQECLVELNGLFSVDWLVHEFLRRL